METIEFNKTGNFWIDNGIVGLYRVLRQLNQELDTNCSIQLPPEKFTIQVDEDGM